MLNAPLEEPMESKMEFKPMVKFSHNEHTRKTTRH